MSESVESQLPAGSTSKYVCSNKGGNITMGKSNHVILVHNILYLSLSADWHCPYLLSGITFTL